MRRDTLMSGKQDIKALEKAVSDFGAALRTAESNMVKAYGSTAMNCIERYFDVTAKRNENRIQAFKALTTANKEEFDKVLLQSQANPLSTEQWNLSSSCTKATTSSTDIQIVFRAVKVTIDRPWFKAQLLRQSKEFLHFKHEPRPLVPHKRSTRVLPLVPL